LKKKRKNYGAAGKEVLNVVGVLSGDGVVEDGLTLLAGALNLNLDAILLILNLLGGDNGGAQDGGSADPGVTPGVDVRAGEGGVSVGVSNGSKNLLADDLLVHLLGVGGGLGELVLLEDQSVDGGLGDKGGGNDGGNDGAESARVGKRRSVRGDDGRRVHHRGGNGADDRGGNSLVDGGGNGDDGLIGLTILIS